MDIYMAPALNLSQVHNHMCLDPHWRTTSLEVPDCLPKEMRDGLNQHTIKLSSEVGIVT